MSDLWGQIEMVFYNIIHQPRWNDILDIVIVSFLFYWLIRFSRHSRTVQVVKGLGVLIIANYISSLLGLSALHWLLQTVLTNGFVLLIVLFQPELRRMLERLGRGTHAQLSSKDKDEDARIIHEITSCLLNLSRRRVGALIVFEQKTGLRDYTETGIRVDARISAALLENIFEPNTPLHDGAVIVTGTRVHAAACVLTLSESNSISQDLGTRHRAALGVSEQTDARVLIVSEETGIISMAYGGRLTRHLDENALNKILSGMYDSENSSLVERVWALIHRAGKEKD